MSISKSIIKLNGSIGGMTFYESGGKTIVRLTRGPKKSAIKNLATYKRLRENMSEFSGSAKAGKSFRLAFADVAATMADRFLVARMTGFMQSILTLGTGDRGKRTIDVAAHRQRFKNFEFNENKVLSSIFFPNYPEPVFNANRDVATLNIPEFNSDSCIKAPKGATHFRIMLACGTVSNYVFDDQLNGYTPAEPDYDALRTLAVSSSIPCGGLTGGPITLTADLGLGVALPANVTVMAAVGIIFFQEINAEMYELASDNAMRIDAVG